MSLKIKIKKNIVPLIVLKRRLKQLATAKVQVGFFSDKVYGPENGSLQVAQVALWQEQGTYSMVTGDARIPERPFMTTTFHQFMRVTKGRRLAKAMASGVASVLFSNQMNGLNAVGDVIKQEMQDQITKWSSPANAPSTVSKKGRNDPLVDTGFMRDCVAFRVRRR